MPGGRPYVLVLQKIFWASAVIQIIFIGALVGAIIQGNKHRHPVLLAFLVTAWLASWVSLMPFFADIWTVARPSMITRSNVPINSPQFKVCQANAILIAYFWTIVPGFAFAFSGEVLRILLGVSRITAIRKSISTGDTLVEEESDAWETDSKRSTKTIKTRFKTWLQTIITPARAMVWEYILVASPFITSLPAPFITAQALARKRWRGVHADQFTCEALGVDTLTKVSMVVMGHLIPAFLVGLAAIGTYMCFRHKSRSIIQSKVHHRLLLRLSALSLLSALGALAYLVLRVGPTGINTTISRKFGWVMPMYMNTFPLIGASLFIDWDVLSIWRSWITLGRYPIEGPLKQTRSDSSISITLPDRPSPTFARKNSHDHQNHSYGDRDDGDESEVADLKSYQWTPSHQFPLTPPRPAPPPPHLRLI